MVRGRRLVGSHREVGPRTGRRPSPRTGSLRLVSLVVAGAVALSAGLAGCDLGRGTSAPTPTPSALSWSQVALPDRTEPVTLSSAGAALVIGAHVSEPSGPRLLVLRHGEVAQVPLQPESPYAQVARWLSIAVMGDRVEAVGGARGGAHANFRWTVWSGTWSGDDPRVVEQPQPFGVFGGWGAGDLTGIAFAGSEPVIAGAWQSDLTGNDVSLWRRSGERWGRLSSTGSPLGSTPEALNGARFLTTTGQGLALAGSVTELGGGGVASVPALWTAPSADGPWHLTKLQASDPLAEAHAARCEGERCVVVGVDSGRLAVWDVTSGRSTRAAVPDKAAREDQAAPAPVVLRGDDFLAVTGSVLQRTASGWREWSAPAGLPTAAAAVGDTLYLVTVDNHGRSRLWAAQP